MNSDVPYTSNHKYHIEPYNEVWKKWYQNEEKVIRKALGNSVDNIYHVGSTAIPKMAAKPQLDILVTTKNLLKIDSCNKKMEEAGYVVYGDALKKGGRLFSRWKDGEKIVNIHVFLVNSPVIHEYLDIKEFLLANPEVVKEYAELKMELYKKYPDDYLKYREAKDKYITELLKKIAES